MASPSQTVDAGFRRADDAPVRWAESREPVPYPAAIQAMEQRAAAIADGDAAEMVWLLEHPPLYTAGVSAKRTDLLWPDRFPVFESGRGGQFTYHGPGQRVAYVMLDLRARERDVRRFVGALEGWLIDAIGRLDIQADRREGRVGIWVERPDAFGGSREDKVAAIGVKIRRWVSFHGVSVNVDPDLGHFGGIVPCGISGHGVTSLAELGFTGGLPTADAALKAAFQASFGPVVSDEPPDLI